MCLNAHTPLSEVMGMITTEPSEIDSCIKLLHKFDSKIFNLSDLQKIYGSPLWDQIQIPVNLKKKLEEIIKDFIDSLKISPASFKPIIINLDSGVFWFIFYFRLFLLTSIHGNSDESLGRIR